MIQFNNVSVANSIGALTNSKAGQGSTAALQSFESELSAAIASTLQKFGIDPSKVAISIGSPSNSASNTASTSSNPVTAGAPVTPGATTPYPTAASVPQNDPMHDILAFDDDYWAKQPPAVQALRGMQDEDQRSMLAGQLASQGYTIDVPIMVWGWDPAKVTDMRHGFGYTWVPSGFQPAVAIAPGLTGVGANQYDPNNPPPGSILV